MIIYNLTQKYKENIVFEQANCEFCDTGCFLIIGKNGSGKSTLLKMLSGLIVNYLGEIIVNENISKLVDEPKFFMFKTGMENIEYLLDEKDLECSKKYINLFGLENAINNKVKTYSLGMKQKLGLIIAFSKKADVILLDEPSNSLDFKTVILLKEAIKEIKKEKLVIISSHDISFFDNELIDDVFTIHDKKLNKCNKRDIEFDIYKVKTKEKIDNANINIVKIEEDYMFIKIKKENIEATALELAKYGLREFQLLDYTSMIYYEEVNKA